jgi:hypothetical protein
VLCVECLCTQERWIPEVVNIFYTAARFSRATVGSSHDDAHQDNAALHTGKVYSVPLNIYRVALHLLRQRRGAAGYDLGTTTKYLRQTTSGAAGIGIGTTAKYLRRTTSAAAGSDLGTTPNYLRGAASNGWAKR